MGGALGAVGSGIGSAAHAVGGGLKGVFNPDITGTGQSAGDLQKIGYSDQDLATLDPKRGMQAGAIKGALGGAFGQDQNGQQQRQPANPIMLQPGPGPVPVDPSYFAPNQFNRNAIYGR